MDSETDLEGPGERYYANPTLMRAARGTYSRSIRAQLAAIGADDLPRNGPFILARVADSDVAAPDLPSWLGVSKQAVSQLVEILVNRGYLDRNTDPEDRRRITLELTDRGRDVGAATYRGVEAVDGQLREMVPAVDIEAMRSVLLALAQIKVTDSESGAGVGRRRPLLRNFSPVFPVSDLASALSHYASLGFKTFSYDDSDDYGFANRDGIGLHLAAIHDHDHEDEHEPAHGSAAAYLYVRDADALYEEWSKPGIGGRTLPVNSTAYKLREGAHIDPDGNLIRFGSPMDE